jgi:hypothetical protein
MAFLVIAGITVHIARGQAVESIERIGTAPGFRAYAGNLRSAVRAEKRSWKVTSTPMIAADATTLRAAVALAAQVACSGNALGGTVTCEVEVNDSPYLATATTADGFNFRRVLALTLREV